MPHIILCQYLTYKPSISARHNHLSSAPHHARGKNHRAALHVGKKTRGRTAPHERNSASERAGLHLPPSARAIVSPAPPEPQAHPFPSPPNLAAPLPSLSTAPPPPPLLPCSPPRRLFLPFTILSSDGKDLAAKGDDEGARSDLLKRKDERERDHRKECRRLVVFHTYTRKGVERS
ncbi:hypothetical protein VPH35_096852 [Triticum aestivum]